MDDNMIRSVTITGCGSYAPDRVMTNQELESLVDTSDEWIVSRTGMKERHIAADDETTSDMAAAAARAALEHAGLHAENLDQIIVATITPDQPWPNTACLVQEKIGAVNACCMGLEAACSGFIYALDVARNSIAAGACDTVMVIGAEKMSSIIDWDDRNTAVLFGDGAGAVILQPCESGGIRGTVMGSDGSLSDLLGVPAGGSCMPPTHETVDQHLHFVKMNGREVFKHAVTNMTQSAFSVLEKTGVNIEEVDWIIPHQANMRIIQAVGQRLGAPLDKFVINVDKYGNTSGASIGLALDEAVKDGRVKAGDTILFIVFGGGFTWGSTLMEWSKS